ncbi:hypothetical protein CBG04_07930 [Limosilactobacillus reuteri]|uniref:capsid assembly scaffolding protein Gp46 family protein n=1 Tax=Limosilactobacillus reuteri TaxID=1598 RepID=UPI000B99CA08|nr:DUF4355 domain-containing protein [Limosilactobacillus reuteri]OYS79003.1 hypothetical protein CBG11_10590 [Limosilactobacillus reuteri]OYS82709.1 hypothetical protein CBG04_07930 [Limosilactobacillus reuteri]OYS84355.1 hypothetical protein CBG14_05715 [Limosilactobacillus reuteri]
MDNENNKTIAANEQPTAENEAPKNDGTGSQGFNSDEIVSKLQKRIGKEQASKNDYKDRLEKAEAKIKELTAGKSVKQLSDDDKAKNEADEKDKTIKELQAKLARQTSLNETDKVFKEAGLKVDDDVLNMIVTNDDKQTYANAQALINYTNKVQEEVRKSFLKGATPKHNGQHVVTKSEIMAIKDDDKRREAIKNHLDLFNGGNQ